jgi:hypothetical membrane protein
MKLPEAGAILWMCCLQYFAGEAIAILGFRGFYSLRTIFISDLGAVECVANLCSRWHAMMNASFLLQGCLIAGGAFLTRPWFPSGWPWTLAIGLIGASGLGVFVVGLAPEDVTPGWHYLGAAENFLFCNAGAALLGIAMLWRPPAYRPAGALALLTGLVGLSGLACIAARLDVGLGPGGVERLTAYPFPIWISGVGAWLLRGRPGGPRSPAIAADPRGRRDTTIHRTGVVRFAMLATALGGPCSAAVAEEKPTSAPASAICIVPLSPPSRDARADASAPKMKQDATPEVLPGMPSPLLTLQDFPGRWIIDADRRLVPYDGFWPVHSYLDKGDQARESWSSQTVAITYGGGVSVLRPGAARFEEISGSHEVAREHGAFSGPFVLPHRKETVVTASDGAAYRVEDKTLVPWMSPQDLERHGVAGVSRVF